MQRPGGSFDRPVDWIRACVAICRNLRIRAVDTPDRQYLAAPARPRSTCRRRWGQLGRAPPTQGHLVGGAAASGERQPPRERLLPPARATGAPTAGRWAPTRPAPTGPVAAHSGPPSSAPPRPRRSGCPPAPLPGVGPPPGPGRRTAPPPGRPPRPRPRRW
mgnify:CR=1 FL=1